MKKRLAIVATHPVQYQAHWFRALAADSSLEIEVLYCHHASSKDQAEAGFGVAFEWDVPLLEGYPWRFLANVAETPSVSSFSGVNTPELGPLLVQNKYDAVLALGWHFQSAWQAFRACWRNRIPVMARSDSHLRTPRSLPTRLAKWLPYRVFIGRLDACLAVGQWSSEYFRHYGAGQEKIFVVPHTIDERWFTRGLQSARETARREMGLAPDQVVFLFVGKFVPFKRPMDFARAVALAAREGAPVSGVMIGDGPLRGECEAWVRRESAPIRFAGFINQNDLATAYSWGDALILPSQGDETWGLVVNEAMAGGLPCLVSDQVGSGPDLVSPGETGEVFRTGDIGDLRSKILELARQPAQLRDLGERARCKAQGQSVARAVAALERAVEYVTGPRRTRP